MDVVYGDLENYNDDNVVEELRNENLELKQKIENYASAMDKIQKDFDELAAEFKKLEMNYSSLLKTARAEIERKTQTITNLNIEKDAMVLNAIQNQSFGDFRRLISQSRFDAQSNNDPRCRKKEITDYKNIKQERAKDAESKNYSASNSKQDAVFCENKHKTKDYTFLKHTESIKPSSVHSRRKSVSAIRCENKFDLSDDEYNQPLKPYEIRKNSTSHSDHRQSRSKHRSNKGSGSSADDKYSSYKESSLETFYRSKDNRYFEVENRKSRHRYDMDRHQNFSPERLHRRATRHAGNQYNEIRHSDTEESRYALTSRSHDHRTYYDKNYDRDYEGYKQKHKVQDDCHESRSKRMKYSHTPRYPDEQVWQQEPHYTDEELLHKVIGDIQYTSCQSPDMISDHSAQPITEIKLTAEVPLEDPRLRSKKYSLKTSEEKVVLSTVESKDVNLKPIDKFRWNIQQVMLPVALQHPPEVKDISETIGIFKSMKHKENIDDDALVVQEHKNISNASNYKDIGSNDTQKPVLPSEIASAIAPVNQSKSNPDISVKPAVQNKMSKAKTPREAKTVSNKESDNLVSMQNVDKVSTNLKQTLEASVLAKSIYESMNTPELNMSSIDEDEIGDLLLTGLTSVNNSNTKEQCATKNTQLHIDQKESSNVMELKERRKRERTTLKENEAINKILEFENRSPDRIVKKSTNVTSHEITLTDKDKNSKTLNPLQSSESVKKLTSKEIVAGDLELSDETNDNQDFHKHLGNLPNKESLGFVIKEDIREEINPIPEIDIKVIRILSPDEEIKSKGKGRTKKTRVSTKKSEPKTDKKSKEKGIITNISTPMKNKFSDLFGDSSSLITPEDLGLGAIQVTSNYEPIIEDAQDGLELKDNKPDSNRNSKPDTVKSQVEAEPETNNDRITQTHDNELKPVSSQVCSEDKAKDETISCNTNAVPSVPIIQVLEPESDVVKTVIISTGTQPQFTKSTVPDTGTSGIHSQTKTFHDRNTLIALATSTPHKSICEPIIKLPDDSCNSNDSRSSSNTHSVTSSAQADDIPDVRIFLKRKKRRVIKKT